MPAFNERKTLRAALVAGLILSTTGLTGVAHAQTAPWSQGGSGAAGNSEPSPFGAPAPNTQAQNTPSAGQATGSGQGPSIGPSQSQTTPYSPPHTGGLTNIPGGNNSIRDDVAKAALAVPPAVNLGLQQKAWDNPSTHIGPGQTRPGTKPIHWTPGLIPTINLRQDMITTIDFPADVEIVDQPILSDPNGFEAVITNTGHSITIRPSRIGIDGNVQVSTEDGQAYIFYLRSQPWDYKYIPDIYVPVSGRAGNSGGSGGGYSGSGSDASQSPIRKKSYTDDPAYDNDISARISDRPRALETKPGVDYAAHADTGNGRIRRDLTIKIPDPGSRVIAPIGAWRDDKFIYLDFGPRAASMTQWPVASVVIDGIPSPVQTQVSGPNRSIMIIKAIGNVMLSNREHVVCIMIPLINNDPRLPALDETYKNTRKSGDHPTDIYNPNATPPLGTTPAGTGDYLDPRAQYTSVESTSTNVSDNAQWPGKKDAPYHMRTGTYDIGVATILAEEIGQGYRGNVPAGAQVIVIPASQVSPENASSLQNSQPAIARVEITAKSPVLADRLCKTLKQYNHICNLY